MAEMDDAKTRITPDELEAYLVVMLRHGCHDFAGDDFRIVLSPARVAAIPDPRPLQPVEKHDSPKNQEEEDDVLYASVT